MRLVTYTPATRCSSPSLTAANPFAMLEAEMSRIFGNTLANSEQGTSEAWIPVEINEDKEAYQLQAALPGVRKEDIALDVLDGVLTLRATRHWKAGEAAQSQAFARSISLSEDVDTEKITATHENGLLTVRLAKREQQKPRKIAVE